MRPNPLLIGLATVVLIGCSTIGPETTPPGEVRILGGDSYLRFADLDLHGAELGAYEGMTVQVRIGILDPKERKGFGKTRVHGGEFSLEFLQVREEGLYKSLAWYIDVNGDGRCTEGVDAGFQAATGGSPGIYTLEAAEWMKQPADAGFCANFSEPWPA